MLLIKIVKRMVPGRPLRQTQKRTWLLLVFHRPDRAESCSLPLRVHPFPCPLPCSLLPIVMVKCIKNPLHKCRVTKTNSGTFVCYGFNGAFTSLISSPSWSVSCHKTGCLLSSASILSIFSSGKGWAKGRGRPVRGV